VPKDSLFDRVQRFRCWKCNEFVNDTMEVCGFCGVELDDPIKIAAAVSRGDEESRSVMRSHYAQHVKTGIALAVVGAFILVICYGLGSAAKNAVDQADPEMVGKAASRGAAYLLIGFQLSTFVIILGVMLLLGGLGDLLDGLSGWVEERKKFNTA
jgi:hypothetical protein